MAVLTDYYCFSHKAGSAKTRLDCTASTGNYDEFEIRRCRKQTKTTRPGQLVIYCTPVPDTFKAEAQRKADRSLTIGSRNVSSLFVYEAAPVFGHGDFKGTTDALLFTFEGFENLGTDAPAQIEVFIARGLKNTAQLLYNMLTDGGLDEEMEALRQQAKKEEK